MSGVSFLEWLGLPEEIGVFLFTLGFILVLAPYAAGHDFGPIKVPIFERKKRRYLQYFGPAFLLFTILINISFFDVPLDGQAAESRLTQIQKEVATHAVGAIHRLEAKQELAAIEAYSNGDKDIAKEILANEAKELEKSGENKAASDELTAAAAIYAMDDFAVAESIAQRAVELDSNNNSAIELLELILEALEILAEYPELNYEPQSDTVQTLSSPGSASPGLPSLPPVVPINNSVHQPAPTFEFSSDDSPHLPIADSPNPPDIIPGNRFRPPPPPIGFFEVIGENCSAIQGWAVGNSSSTPIDVHIYVNSDSGEVFLASVVASGYVEDPSGTPNSGFLFSIPSWVKTGSQVEFVVYAFGDGKTFSNKRSELSGPEFVTCY